MKLKRYSKRFSVTAVFVALASLFGLYTAFSFLVHGQEITASLLTVALAVLGVVGVYRYFGRKIIERWIFFAWILPQTLLFTVNTYDHVNKTVISDLVFGTFLIPNLSFNLAWELRQNSYLVVNFNVLAIPAVFVLVSILSHLKEDDQITEQVSAGNGR